MDHVAEEIEISASPSAVYELWKDPDTFVEIVGPLDDAIPEGNKLEFSAQGPFGVRLTGEARIVEDVPGERIAWETTQGALKAHGEVVLEPAADGTRLCYELSYEMPGGPVGSAVAGAVTDARGAARSTLERLKAIAERQTSSETSAS